MLIVGIEAQMPEPATAMVGDKPDAIVATSDWAIHGARASTIPIVAAPMGVDPIRAGVAEEVGRTRAATSQAFV